jgi:anti-sigma B factor antagonist
MSRFRMETELRPGGLLVRLFGEFDLHAFERVDAMLAAAQLDSGSHVVVDLRSLEFMDPAGIRALINARERAEAVGARFRVIRGPEKVQRVLELAGLDSRLDFIDVDGR